jgi:hypothetical protein
VYPRAATQAVAPGLASLLRWAPGPSRVMWPQLPLPGPGQLQGRHVSCGLSSRCPATAAGDEGSEVLIEVLYVEERMRSVPQQRKGREGPRRGGSPRGGNLRRCDHSAAVLQPTRCGTGESASRPPSGVWMSDDKQLEV